MILTRVHPGPAESFELDAADTRARLLELYSPPASPWLRLNLVTSVSGSAAGSDGTSETLTGTADRRILGVIRELSDVVLVGAASVRAEGYQLPRRSTLAIVTTSGDLSGHQLAVGDSSRIVVVCPPAAVGRVRETLGNSTIVPVEAPGGSIPPLDIIEALRNAGYASIVCEGGPHLANQLLAEGLVDELCLTTSPVLSSVALAPFGASLPSTIPLDLEQVIIDESGSIFARWRLSPSAPEARH